MGDNHKQRKDTPSEQSCLVSMTGADNSNNRDHKGMDGFHHQATRVTGEDCG